MFIVDCSDPDEMTVAERREERIKAESNKFDEDHYMLVHLIRYSDKVTFPYSVPFPAV